MRNFTFTFHREIFLGKVFVNPKKSLRFFLTVALFLLFVLGICAERSQANELYQNQMKMNKPAPLRLAIPTFNKTGGDSRYDILARSMPEIIAIRLLDNDRVQYIDHSLFWKIAAKRYSLEQLELDPNLIFRDEILDELKIDLILKGNYFEYRGKLRFEAVLKDRRNHKTYSISSQVVDAKQIFAGIKDFGSAINTHISELGYSKSAKRIAVLCFKDTSLQKSISNKQFQKNITFFLASYLDPKRDVVIIPLSKTKKYCENERVTKEKLLKKLKVDAIIDGNFEINQNKISIYPALYIYEHNKTLQLDSIKGDMTNYLDLESKLVNGYNVVLNAIIENGDKWNTSILQFTSTNAKDYIDKGKEYMKLNENLYLASYMFREAIRIKPESEETHYLLGIVMSKKENYEEALLEFNKVLKINSKNAKAFQGIGNAQLGKGEYHAALKAFKAAEKIDPDLEYIHFSLGEVYYILNENERAIKELAKASEIEDNKSMVFNMLGRVYRSQQLMDKAKNAFSKSLESDPKNDEAKSNLSAIYLEEGKELIKTKDYEKALTKLTKSKELSANENVYDWISYVFTLLKRYADVTVLFEEASKSKRVDATLYNNYGYALNKLNRKAEAIEAYNKAIKKNPSLLVAYSNKGLALDALMRHEEAIKVYEQAIKINPNFANTYNYKGLALDALMRHEEAIKAYEQAIKINPNLANAYNNKAYSLIELGRYEEAVKFAQKAINIKPDMANPYNQKGYGLYRLGKRSEGIKFIKKAIALDPNYGGSYFNLARIYAKEGKVTDAIKNLEKAARYSDYYKHVAKNSKELIPIRNEPEFEKLVGD